MAKSATISKNTKSKKHNKKPSKIGNFLSKLNPNTPKKKLLTFVLVFALAGGGYYAYSSFAATTGSVAYNADKMIGSNGAYKITEDSYSKRGYTVFRLPTGKEAAEVESPSGALWAREARACAKFRVPNEKMPSSSFYPSLNLILYMPDFSKAISDIRIKDVYEIRGKEYVFRCTPWIVLNSSNAYTSKYWASFQGYGYPINVAILSVEYR